MGLIQYGPKVQPILFLVLRLYNPYPFFFGIYYKSLSPHRPDSPKTFLLLLLRLRGSGPRSFWAGMAIPYMETVVGKLRIILLDILFSTFTRITFGFLFFFFFFSRIEIPVTGFLRHHACFLFLYLAL